MMNQLPPELFSQQPIRSEFARSSRIEVNPRRRRLAVLIGGALALIVGGYFIFSGNSQPTEIPTIQAEGAAKERPEQPGGAEIPHQDMLVFDKIENSGQESNKDPVEHLLPQPETPQVNTTTVQTTVSVDAPVDAKTASVESTASNQPPVIAAPTTSVVQQAAPVVQQAKQAPVVMPDVDKKQNVETITATKEVRKVDAKTEVASLPKEIFNGDKGTKAEKTEKSAAGSFVVQLASLPNADAAQSETKTFQSKYASLLRDAKLRVVRADLGAKGVYHRIQSAGMPEAQARSLCASLKSAGASCIVVHP